MHLGSDDRFIAMLSGNHDAHGADWGQSIMEPPDWEAHLDGSNPTGVYPMWRGGETTDGYNWHVRWGCVDLDVKRDGKSRWDYETEEDAHVAAVNLVRVLDALEVTSWIEVTKSHGRHVWVFMDGQVYAQEMRRALLVACEIAGVPPTEVNPKSEGFDDPDTLGNYVRVPYPGRDNATNRYMVDHEGVRYPYENFVNAAWALRNVRETIVKVADMYVPPVPRITLIDGEYDGSLNDDVTPYVRAVLQNGPTDGRDRSGWLWWLAGKCLDEGLTPECALAVLTTADDTWTHKYTTRKDGERRLHELVEKVYA